MPLLLTLDEGRGEGAASRGTTVKTPPLFFFEKAGNKTEPFPCVGEQEIPRQHLRVAQTGKPQQSLPVACIWCNRSSRCTCPQAGAESGIGGALGLAPRKEPCQDEAQRPMTRTQAAGWRQRGRQALHAMSTPHPTWAGESQALCEPRTDAATNRTEKTPSLPLGLHGGPVRGTRPDSAHNRI